MTETDVHPPPADDVDEDARLEEALARGLHAGARPSARSIGAALARALDETTDPGTEVVVAPKGLGRVTGWVIVCEEHGTRTVAVQNQDAAVDAARTHLRDHHRARGRIRIRTEAIGARRKAKKGRRRG